MFLPKTKKEPRCQGKGRGAGEGELSHATRIRHVCDGDDDDDDNNDEVDRRLWHKRCNDDADCDVDCDCDCDSDCVGTSSA